MLDYISGKKGTGKTRILTESAVYTSEISKGNVVFLEYGNKLSRLIPFNIRHINLNDYGINSSRTLFGFISGLCASDFDLTDIFIDTTNCTCFCDGTNIDDFLEILQKLSSATGTDIHLALCDNYNNDICYADIA